MRSLAYSFIKLIDNALNKQLRADFGTYRVLVNDSALAPRADREKLCQLMFEVTQAKGCLIHTEIRSAWDTHGVTRIVTSLCYRKIVLHECEFLHTRESLPFLDKHGCG